LDSHIFKSSHVLWLNWQLIGKTSLFPGPQVCVESFRSITAPDHVTFLHWFTSSVV